MGIWLSRMIATHGECVQPLQSKKLLQQLCSRSWAAWTLTWLVGTWDGMGLVWFGLVGFVEVGFFRLWVGHGETPWCDRVCYLRGDEFATCLLDLLRHTVSPLLSASQTKSQAILVDSLHVIFSPTCWVATISLLKLASIVALGQIKYWSQNQEYQQEPEDKD